MINTTLLTDVELKFLIAKCEKDMFAATNDQARLDQLSKLDAALRAEWEKRFSIFNRDPGSAYDKGFRGGV